MKQKKVKNKAQRLRISVTRSNKHIAAQIVDDATHTTLATASDIGKKSASTEKNRIKRAHAVGLALAKVAKTKKVKNVYFDRRSYKYHGRVKALAEGAREGGLVF
jgi:large subunit ribosomal protein L18